MTDWEALRPLAAGLPLGVVHVDEEGVCDLAGGLLANVIDVHPVASTGRPVTSIWVHRPTWLTMVGQALDGEPAQLVERIGDRTLQLFAQPEPDPDPGVRSRGGSGEPRILGVLVVALDLTDSYAQADARRREAEVNRALLHQALRAQDEERRRIAADIHDDTIQVVAAAALRMQMLRHRLDPHQAADVAPVIEALDQASARLRSLIFDLDSAPGELFDAAHVRSLADEVLRGTGIEVEVVGSFDSAPGDVQTAALRRITHEALVNVRKHSGADRVEVRLFDDAIGHRMLVTDNGRGMPSTPSRPGHLGLRSVRDRAAAVGGVAEAYVPVGGGTELRVWVPRRLGVGTHEDTVRAPMLEIVESLQDAFIAVDTDYRIVYANRRAAELSGTTPEALVGRNMWDDIPPEHGIPFRRAYATAMATGEPQEVEALFEPWGRWMRNRVFPSAHGLTIFFTDETEARDNRLRVETLLTDGQVLREVVRELVEAPAPRAPKILTDRLVELSETVTGARLRVGERVVASGEPLTDDEPPPADRYETTAVLDVGVGASVRVDLRGLDPDRVDWIASVTCSILSLRLAPADAAAGGVLDVASDDTTERGAVADRT